MILIGYDGSEDAKVGGRARRGAVRRPDCGGTDGVGAVHRDARPHTGGDEHGGGDRGHRRDRRGGPQDRRADGRGGRRPGPGRRPGCVAAGPTREGSVAQAVLEEAGQANASAVVLGSRGLGGIGSLLLGSVSHAVLQHADRAVVVVPSPKVARSRGERLHPEAAG